MRERLRIAIKKKMVEAVEEHDPLRFWESGDLLVSKGILREGPIDFARQPRLNSSIQIVIERGWSLSGFEEDFEKVSFSRLLHGLNPAEEQKLQFRIGFAETELDRSFETLFKSMCLGERAQSTVRACLTYRDKENSKSAKWVSFEGIVNLLNVPESPQVSQIPIKSKLNLVQELKDLGTQLFTEGRYIDAFPIFRQAFSLALFAKSEAEELKLDDSKDFDLSLIHELQIKCGANLVACHFQLGNFDHTISLADCILPESHSSIRVKLLYRRGVAYLRRNEFEMAVSDLTEALRCDPTNKAIQQYLQKALGNRKESDKRLQEALKKMFV